MLALYRTLSLRYLSRRWVRALLIVASIALGVATLVATRALNQTMTKAGLGAFNPIAGQADLVVSNGEVPLSRDLAKELTGVDGIKMVHPRIFDNAKLVKPDKLKDRNVLIMGIDLDVEMQDDGALQALTFSDEVKNLFDGMSFGKNASKLFNLGQLDQIPWVGPFNPFTKAIAVIGKELDDELPPGKPIVVRKNVISEKTITVLRAGWIKGNDHYAILGGYVLVTDLDSAAKILELPPGKVQRLDITLNPGASRAKTRKEVERILAGRAKVGTPEEQNQSLQSVMDGMQVGFTLGGMAALVVGLFLVYMSLSVSVTERRHEIGILKALGGTQGQILMLFAGEAMLMGLVGSLLGVPLGYALANVGLAPVQNIIKDIFGHLDARQVDFSWPLTLAAIATGVFTSLVACLAPAITASRDNPAEAVRRIVKAPGRRHLVQQAAASLLLILIGVLAVVLRDHLPFRLGTYGGLIAVLLGSLVACPLLAAFLARLIQPVIRTFLGIEWRLAADNLVRSPGRTGLVIGALASGVALVVQTAGLIHSNRIALHDWVEDSIAADLIVTAGGPVGSGGVNPPLPSSVVAEFRGFPEIEYALAVRFRKVPFRDTLILLIAVDATPAYVVEKSRNSKGEDIELYKKIADQPGAIIVSRNFAAKHGVRTGDAIQLPSPTGEVQLTVIGAIEDYGWNHGSIFINRPDFLRFWQDDQADLIDLYLKPDVDQVRLKEEFNKKFSTRFELFVSTRGELQLRVNDLIERLYGIAYGQQIVVMLVAALGVVTALLISVLQRRREMGLLRAIGASQNQVIRSVLAEAGLMGFIGTIIGLAIGIPLQWFVLQVIIFEESGFLFPVHIPWVGALMVAGGAMAVATLAGLGPALYAVRTRIPEAIAYE